MEKEEYAFTLGSEDSDMAGKAKQIEKKIRAKKLKISAKTKEVMSSVPHISDVSSNTSDDILATRKKPGKKPNCSTKATPFSKSFYSAKTGRKNNESKNNSSSSYNSSNNSIKLSNQKCAETNTKNQSKSSPIASTSTATLPISKSPNSTKIPIVHQKPSSSKYICTFIRQPFLLLA